MLSCKEVSRLISESLDRKLPFRQRIGVRMHLMMCSLCRRYRAQAVYLRYLFTHIAGDDRKGTFPEERLSEPARERIKQILRNNRN
ncbi:zf-HC2 domain-containing protein [Verrucomicrobia bacterium S94]|nr:zf-HC2 domain-containing protein [Verrucomicrobia bacterium S94]